MYLSVLKLNPRNNNVRKGYRNCQDMHRNFMRCFNDNRKNINLLYRLGPNNSVYMLSNKAPNMLNIFGMSLIKSRKFDPNTMFKDGATYQFQILASPCSKVRKEGKKNSCRNYLTSEIDRKDWLDKKAEQYGFKILSCRQSERPSIKGYKEQSGKLVFRTVNFTGTLIITNKDKFIDAYCNGIGSGKAYGLGMLMLM